MGSRLPPGAVVIVADNDVSGAENVAQGLRALGLEPLVCSSLKETFAVLKPARRALLFLDVNIDGVDCFDLLAKLTAKASSSHRRYVIVAMSSFGGPNVALSLVRAGAYRFFTKPVRAEFLESMVADAAEEMIRPPEKTVPPAPVAPVAPAASAAPAAPAAPAVTVSDGSSSESTVDGGILYPLDRMTVVKTVPDEPGVVTFYDGDKTPIAVEWCGNCSQRLRYYVDLHPASSELARTARWFEVLATGDQGQEAKVFDRIVTLLGRFPALTPEAPEGSAHRNPPPLGKKKERDARITDHARTTDPELVERIRRLLAERPEDERVQDWLGYTLYSNGMLDEAIEFYTELITKGSRRGEHFFYCANALWKRGDGVRAIKLWRMATVLCPDTPIGRKSCARLDQAMAGQDPELTQF